MGKQKRQHEHEQSLRWYDQYGALVHISVEWDAPDDVVLTIAQTVTHDITVVHLDPERVRWLRDILLQVLPLAAAS